MHTGPITARGCAAVATHLLVVLDLVLDDDPVGLVGLLPGQLHATLLHALLQHLAHLGRGWAEQGDRSETGRQVRHRETGQIEGDRSDTGRQVR